MTETVARLRSFIERIERLEEEKAAIAHDITEVYTEAKSEGYNVKILRVVVGLRKMDPDARQKQDELVEVYMSALGEKT